MSSFVGYLKGKSTLMIYDRHPELQSKWDKSFWPRGYYVSTIGNITEDVIKKYIREQSEESRKEEVSLYRGPVTTQLKAIRRIVRDCNDIQHAKGRKNLVLLPNFSCHSLRHTFTTRLIENGVNINVIQELCGHTRSDVTLDIYTTVTKELKMRKFGSFAKK